MEVDDPRRRGGRCRRPPWPRLGFLADLVSIGTLFAFVVVSAAVWILRITDPDTPRPFRAPWLPFVSTMGMLVNGGMMFYLGPENWMRLFVWLIVGLVIYFGYSRHHSALRTHSKAGSRMMIKLC